MQVFPRAWAARALVGDVTMVIQLSLERLPRYDTEETVVHESPPATSHACICLTVHMCVCVCVAKRWCVIVCDRDLGKCSSCSHSMRFVAQAGDPAGELAQPRLRRSVHPT